MKDTDSMSSHAAQIFFKVKTLINNAFDTKRWGGPIQIKPWMLCQKHFCLLDWLILYCLHILNDVNIWSFPICSYFVTITFLLWIAVLFASELLPQHLPNKIIYSVYFIYHLPIIQLHVIKLRWTMHYNSLVVIVYYFHLQLYSM